MTPQIQPCVLVVPCPCSQNSWIRVWPLPDPREDNVSRKEVQKPRGIRVWLLLMIQRQDRCQVIAWGWRLQNLGYWCPSPEPMPWYLKKSESGLCRICPRMSTNFYHCTMSHEIWGSNAHWHLGRGPRRDRGQEGWCWQPVCGRISSCQILPSIIVI